MKRDNFIDFFHQSHQWNNFTKCGQKCDVLGFSRAQSYLSLKLGFEVDWTVGIIDEKSSPRHEITGVVWISLIPAPRKISINITF